MNGWLAAALGAMLGGIAVYFRLRRVNAGESAKAAALREEAEARRVDAERARSNAEGELKAKREENERLRREAEAGLNRQAGQFRAEIAALNERIRELDRKIQRERDLKEELAGRLAASLERHKAKERLFEERERQYGKTLDQGAARFTFIQVRLVLCFLFCIEDFCAAPCGAASSTISSSILPSASNNFSSFIFPPV